MAINEHVYKLLKNHYMNLPHCLALGLTFEREENNTQTISVDWQEHLVGNAQTQVIHGGVITTLVDIASAVAVAAQLSEPEILATLDMRIDYLQAARPKARMYATAECYKLTGQVAFIRTVCYQDDLTDPFALGTASFMLTPIPDNLLEAFKL